MAYKIAPFFCAILFFNFSSALAEGFSEKPIVVIIPSYNNEDWFQKNLGSVLMQKYENYRVIYINDASTDGTGSLVSQYLLENDPENKVTLFQNLDRIGALANIYHAVWMCKSSEIVVTLDGDDWFASDCVLQIVNEAYSDPRVWMTYGQYDTYPGGFGFGALELPHWVIEHNCYRFCDWVTTHLRTFYAGLFQKINIEDFLYEGKFYPVAWDLSFMFPMLEMAGPHSKFIPDLLYIYNIDTMLSDNKHSSELQQHLEGVIRGKKRYEPLSKHPISADN